jgi:hypothetical protein
MLVFFGRRGVLKTFFKESVYLQQLANFIVPISVFIVPIFVFIVPIFVFKVPILVFKVPILVGGSWPLDLGFRIADWKKKRDFQRAV